RGLIADSKSTFHLIGRHSLTSLAKQMCGGEPFDKRQVGIVEDRIAQDGELVIALRAPKDFCIGGQAYHLALAAETFNTIRPCQSFQKFAASFVTREGLAEVNNVHG